MEDCFENLEVNANDAALQASIIVAGSVHALLVEATLVVALPDACFPVLRYRPLQTDSSPYSDVNSQCRTKYVECHVKATARDTVGT